MSRLYCNHMVRVDEDCEECEQMQTREWWKEQAKQWAGDLVKYTIAFTIANLLVAWMGWTP